MEKILGRLAVVTMPCNRHNFHPNCISQWVLCKSKEVVSLAIDDENFDNGSLMPKIICSVCRENIDNGAIYNDGEEDEYTKHSVASLKNFSKTIQLYMTALYNVKIYQAMIKSMVSRLLNSRDENGNKFSSFKRLVPGSFWNTQESLGDYQVFLQSTGEIIAEITHDIVDRTEKLINAGNNTDQALHQKKVNVLEYKLEQIFHLLNACRPYATKFDEFGEPKAFNDKTRLPVHPSRLKTLLNLENRLEIHVLLGYYLQCCV